jgi:hypothetical protein
LRACRLAKRTVLDIAPPSWPERCFVRQVVGPLPVGRACSAQMTFPSRPSRVPQRWVNWATRSRPRPPSSKMRARRRCGAVLLASETSQVSVDWRISRSWSPPRPRGGPIGTGPFSAAAGSAGGRARWDAHGCTGGHFLTLGVAPKASPGSDGAANAPMEGASLSVPLMCTARPRPGMRRPEGRGRHLPRSGSLGLVAGSESTSGGIDPGPADGGVSLG